MFTAQRALYGTPDRSKPGLTGRGRNAACFEVNGHKLCVDRCARFAVNVNARDESDVIHSTVHFARVCAEERMGARWNLCVCVWENSRVGKTVCAQGLCVAG